MSDVRVLLVDDSSVIRGIITRILEAEEGISVVGSASNGDMAVSTYKRVKPDVVLLDIEMPVKDGITALGEIMEFDRQAKVIMCSTLTVDNAEITMRAMKIGAMDYIPKPTSNSEINGSDDFKERVVRLVKAIKNPTLRPTRGDGRGTSVVNKTIQGLRSEKDVTLRPAPPLHWKPQVIAIGSSTGGPQALFNFMTALKGVQLPVVITQHMPPTFTTLLAQHITSQAGFECAEGKDGIILEKGKAVLAPGGHHMGFTKDAEGRVMVKLNEDPPENFCKPAVDPMLRSLMDHYDGRILSVILTGMGSDGQRGVEKLVAAGGYCVAQDQATSVVWGMPGAVANAGLCSAILPLEQMASWVRNHARTG